MRVEAVRVASAAGDDDGLLVFAAGRLVAVLVRLSDLHGELAGRWFAEALFGRVQTATSASPTFADLDEALTWIAGRIH